jgi:DNA-binding HxlR family transcriptional regulator
LSGYGQAQVRKRSGCLVDFALDVFGDRWTLLIIRDLRVRR